MLCDVVLLEQHEHEQQFDQQFKKCFKFEVMSSPDNFGQDSSSENASQPASLTDSMALVNKILVSF
jgi:hypothetical protein